MIDVRISIRRVFTVGLVLGLLATACAPAPAASQQPPAPGGTAAAATALTRQSVRVGALPFTQYTATFYIGEKWIADCFALDASVSRFNAAITAAESLRAGTIDVTFGGVTSFLPSIVAGFPLYLIGSLGYGGYRFIRRPDVQVNDYGDLKGKRVGIIRGALELIDVAALQKAGLTWSDQPGKADVTFVYLPDTAAMAQALDQKQLDAMITSEPYATQQIANGQALEVKKPYDTAMGKISKVVAVSKDFYAKREAAQRFLTAFVYATSWLDAHPDVREKYTRDKIFAGQLSHQDYADSMANAPTGVDLTMDEVQKTSDLMFQAGQMKEKVSATDVVKLDLLDVAKQQAAQAKCQQP